MDSVQHALALSRKHRESGGITEVSAPRPPRRLHVGPIHSPVAGRTDHLPIHVPSGSYVLPADIVSAGGEGNTMAGYKTLRRTFGGSPYGTGNAPYGEDEGVYRSPLPRATGGRAAGILFLDPQKNVLLMRRTGKDHRGEWALPAGGIEKGERPSEAALRETREEAGYDHDGGLSPFMHSDSDGVDFTTFVAHSERFKPKLNDEHDDAVWVKPDEAQKMNLHPGVKRALDKLARRTGKAHGGEATGVPIVAAGGEWVVPPHHVRAVGNGDMDAGHRVLDAFVKRVRKELIADLQKLPGPKRD